MTIIKSGGKKPQGNRNKIKVKIFKEISETEE